MKVFSISDLHLSFSTDKPMNVFGDAWEGYWGKIVEDWNEKVSDEDIVLLAGDLSWGMKIDDARADFAQIGKLKGRKVIVKGNHDYWWSSLGKVKSMVSEYGVYPIQNNAVKLDGFVFFGTRGWVIPTKDTSEVDRKIYEHEILRLTMSVEDMKKQLSEGDVPVGLIHYPPFNVKFDESELTKIFSASGAKKVVYGHLHGKNSRVLPVVNRDGVDYYITSCDQVDNKLILLYDTDVKTEETPI